MPAEKENLLGNYLKDRRSKLDPAALGFPMARRRTPGLRREEVAQRASVSATWYTWLEQGRGGAPSADVIDRIASALMLTEAEREHVYILALGRPPEVRYEPARAVTPQLQRVLDAMEFIPAFVKTSTWDVIAWNRAAGFFLGYDTLQPSQRNILRRLFTDPRVRAAQTHWDGVARFAVASFRADAARSGAAESIKVLVDELCLLSPEFEELWKANDVGSSAHEGVKYLQHPQVGTIGLEYSIFAVDGRTDLSMVIYNPATPADGEKVKSLLNVKTPATVF